MGGKKLYDFLVSAKPLVVPWMICVEDPKPPKHSGGLPSCRPLPRRPVQGDRVDVGEVVARPDLLAVPGRAVPRGVPPGGKQTAGNLPPRESSDPNRDWNLVIALMIPMTTPVTEAMTQMDYDHN